MDEGRALRKEGRECAIEREVWGGGGDDGVVRGKKEWGRWIELNRFW